MEHHCRHATLSYCLFTVIPRCYRRAASIKGHAMTQGQLCKRGEADAVGHSMSASCSCTELEVLQTERRASGQELRPTSPLPSEQELPPKAPRLSDSSQVTEDASSHISPLTDVVLRRRLPDLKSGGRRETVDPEGVRALAASLANEKPTYEPSTFRLVRISFKAS